MTLRISQFAAVCGLGLLALPGVVQAQAPRYQSPLSVPNAPQPQVTLPVTPAITPNGMVVEDVIVHVNDLIITRSDVERAELALAEEDRQSGASPTESAQRQKDLLRDMIDKELLLSRGKELGVDVSAEVVRQLDEIRKQNKMATMEDLEAAALVYGYVPHIRRIGEEKLDETKQKRHPARRWVSERCLSWWNGCRSILVRWAKKACNYLAFIELDSALLWYRRIKLRS